MYSILSSSTLKRGQNASSCLLNAFREIEKLFLNASAENKPFFFNVARTWEGMTDCYSHGVDGPFLWPESSYGLPPWRVCSQWARKKQGRRLSVLASGDDKNAVKVRYVHLVEALTWEALSPNLNAPQKGERSPETLLVNARVRYNTQG